MDATIEPSSNSEDDFILHLERLDLSEVVKSLEGILVQRFRTERLRLDLKIPSRPITVSADRVLLRQILLSLVNYGLQLCAGNSLGLWLESQPDRNVIHINFETDEQWELNREEGKDLLNYVRSWAQRMNVQIDERYPLPGQKGNVSLRLMFASVQHRIILIVDDQVTALRMFERYLSHTGIEVIGITNPEQTLEVARKVQPNLIILDVMMPRLDGWEVLQALQLNPKTSKIPILVCSAWMNRSWHIHWEQQHFSRSLFSKDSFSTSYINLICSIRSLICLGYKVSPARIRILQTWLSPLRVI